MRILILGGTGEARQLAAELTAAGADVISSLAGRVSRPRLPDGPVRIGGFGGEDGLTEFLAVERITHVVDATHPFAATITGHAARAAARAGVPLLVLRRPEWEPEPPWDVVPDIQAAAAAVRRWPGEAVFLTTGRRDLAAFAADDTHRFLVRAVDPPAASAAGDADAALLPPRMTLILGRGPYTAEGEMALMRENGIGLLVTKNSGGPMTEAKLQAARDLGVQVVMVRRPSLPHGVAAVPAVSDALRWLGVSPV
ncbi:MAG TPA: cobalt-precorrin-6A reductase [Trebonia sp.]|nr:cobalt-precorrin-6A reductase [Trebonia sp.]